MLQLSQAVQLHQLHQQHPVLAFQYQHLSFAVSMKLLTQSQEKDQVSGCQFQSKYGLLVVR